MAEDFFSALDVVEDVGTNMVTVGGLVDEKFATAITYTANAWGQLLTYLNSLEKIDFTPQPYEPINVADPGISPYYQDTVGVKPTIADISSYISNLNNVILPIFPVIQIPSQVEIGTGADDVKTKLFDKLASLITNGGTGLGADIETLLWDRMRQRQELQNAKLYLDTENYFAGRGFDLPPGALSGRLTEINAEITRADSNTNNDITVEQARLAQTNTQFYLSESWKAAVASLGEEGTRLVSYNKSIMDTYIAQLEGIKITISKYVSIIESILKSAATQVDLWKAEITLAGLIVDSGYKEDELRVRMSVAGAEIALKQMDGSIEQAKNYLALQVESIKGAVSALSQVCASALTSVNASASLGISTSVGEAAHASISSSYTDGKQESKSEIHNYSESV
jgi:hypothetical protein